MDAGVTPSTVCSDIAKKRCDFYIRCKTDTADNQGRNNDQISPAERANCEAQFSNDRACLVGAAGWANGRAVLDAQKYADCATASYPSNTCVRDLNDVAKKCLNAPFVTAATAIGGLCTSDNECINGWCQIAAGTLCGTCQNWLNADGGTTNCIKDSQCDPSRTFCVGPDGTASNAPCRAYTAIDAGCNFASTNQEECGAGNVCQGTFVNSRCAPGKAENAACTKGRLECLRSGRGQVELICATDIGGFDTCQKRFNTTALGRCNSGESAGGVATNLGTFCIETEFCAAGLCAPRRAANGPCNGVDQCMEGLQCVQNICTPFQDLDGGCGNNSSVCKNLLNCNQTTNTCQPGTSMLDGGCSGGGGPGAIACAEGFCTGGSTSVCAALIADGLPCMNSNAQCQSYSCVNNVCAAACWKP